MKKYTEAERAALIEFTKQRIEALRFSIKQHAFESIRKPLQSELAVAEIALVSLTEKPVHQSLIYGSWYDVDEGEYWTSESDCRRIVYTAPPVAALRMPDYEEDEQAFNYGLHALIDCLEDCGDAGQGLRLAIRAMRLNATAPAEEKK